MKKVQFTAALLALMLALGGCSGTTVGEDVYKRQVYYFTLGLSISASQRQVMPRESGGKGKKMCTPSCLSVSYTHLCNSRLTALGLNSDAALHRSKLILKIYRDVVWVLSEREPTQERTNIMTIAINTCFLNKFLITYSFTYAAMISPLNKRLLPQNATAAIKIGVSHGCPL